MSVSYPRALAVLLCALVAALAATSVSAAPASADPSTCGVRSQGPSYDGAWLYSYYVRNRCSVARRLTVHLPTFGRTLTCRTVNPGATVGYSSSLRDVYWTVVPC